VLIAAGCLAQFPVEADVPGEPFLLFLLAVIGITLAFGARLGLFAAALSTIISPLFFEPIGSLAVRHASDLIKIGLYAVLAGGCVVAFAFFANALIVAGDRLERADLSKSLLLRELAHGVANNFATLAAFIGTKSASVGDAAAKSVLDDAIEQILVMARVHRRLRQHVDGLSLDSQVLMRELCDDLTKATSGRPLSIECKADSRPLCADQAVLLGLVVNELVTNAMKHAFPGGRKGCIRVHLKGPDNRLYLSVNDDGVGFDISQRGGNEAQGRELIRGLCDELRGEMSINSTASGSSFHLSIPYIRPRPHSE
jgi:two-component sensor histidine kinase